MTLDSRRALRATAGDRDAIAVDHEASFVQDLASERRQRVSRQLDDVTAHIADEMSVPVIRSVVHDGIRVQLQRRNYTELGEEVESAVHGGAIGPWIRRFDGIEDLGRGEVMFPGVQYRLEDCTTGRRDPAALRAD